MTSLFWWIYLNGGFAGVILTVPGLGVAVLLLATIFGKMTERWTAWALAAILLLVFSMLSAFSIGLLTWPLALLLLTLSLWKLLHSRRGRKAG
ncbi:MAG: hypothetical protein A2147_04285 [Chloroflexi bacterium RBG_16_57_8]|nr:MAG: hypothetical protein A2147_04285 [Chloroflexi bacterium RBG_16_57_8]